MQTKLVIGKKRFSNGKTSNVFHKLLMIKMITWRQICLLKELLKMCLKLDGGDGDDDFCVSGLVAEGEKPQKQTGGLVVTKDLMGKRCTANTVTACTVKINLKNDLAVTFSLRLHSIFFSPFPDIGIKLDQERPLRTDKMYCSFRQQIQLTKR